MSCCLIQSSPGETAAISLAAVGEVVEDVSGKAGQVTECPPEIHLHKIYDAH